MSRDILTKKDYVEYKQAVDDSFKREGITNLSSDIDEYGEEGPIEPHFSWQPCECCGGTLGGDREHVSGYNPTTKEINKYVVCVDCVYYAEYGQLDDTTMLCIEKSLHRTG